jgi:hypothetical protein
MADDCGATKESKTQQQRNATTMLPSFAISTYTPLTVLEPKIVDWYI